MSASTSAGLQRKGILRFPALQIYSLIFVAILVAHGPLLRLPFFWDEAGYYVPAAHDLIQFHSPIVRTTLDTGHPPLSTAYLAFWLATAGWKASVARVAMLLVAAFALTNVYLLARRLAGIGVAVATLAGTATYSVFFVQSSLTHADLMACAFTLWGLREGIENRLWRSQLAFSLAVLSKETAIVGCVALAAWEILFPPAPREKWKRAAIRMMPAIPLAGWMLYHYAATGHLLAGSSYYLDYNVSTARNALRFVLALAQRFWQLLGGMNMLALTAATAAAMWFAPVRDRDVERGRIAVDLQFQFALVMLAYLITFSLLGGALLTRYLLPCYPLVILIGMSTLHRRILRWEWPAAVIVLIFGLALFFDPPYRFAPEDSLRYKDFVQLHYRAAQFLQKHEQETTILTAWPANDELSRPYLGYVKQPLNSVAVDNFTVGELLKAREARNKFDVVYMFSTKYEPRLLFRSAWWERMNRRFFDYHSDMSPGDAAELLGGRVVYFERKNGEWVAVIELLRPGTSASLRMGAIR